MWSRSRFSREGVHIEKDSTIFLGGEKILGEGREKL
jgi:hypothetical protein